jgi:hypothetical protein
MANTRPITFAEFRHLLEGLGYRHDRVAKGEIFHMSDDRELFFRRYHDRDAVLDLDLVRTKGFLDGWNQMQAADFDAFLESTSKPA